MSLHEELSTAIQRVIEGMDGHEISPSSIAIEVQGRYMPEAIEPHLQWASLEHLKHMARTALARKLDTPATANVGDEDLQASLFSGVLQQHYPTPRKRGADPLYKPRLALSHDEVSWNVRRFHQAGAAWIAHGDAPRAWDDERRSPDAEAKAA